MKQSVPRTLPTAAVCEAAVQACVNWQWTVLPETRKGLSTVRTTRCALGTLIPKGHRAPSQESETPPTFTHPHDVLVPLGFPLSQHASHTCEPHQTCGVMHTPFPPFTLHSLAAIRGMKSWETAGVTCGSPGRGPAPSARISDTLPSALKRHQTLEFLQKRTRDIAKCHHLSFLDKDVVTQRD